MPKSWLSSDFDGGRRNPIRAQASFKFRNMHREKAPLTSEWFNLRKSRAKTAKASRMRNRA